MTSSGGPSHIENAFAQVRTAYRLLHAYHRRLFDLLCLTRDTVAEDWAQLPAPSWGPCSFDAPPKRNADPTEKWVQDFMPLELAYFQWASSAEPKAGTFYLWIQHIGDDALMNDPTTEEPDASTFPSAETSRTKLTVCVVMVLKMNASARLPDWNAVDKRIRKAPGIQEAQWTDEQVHLVEASDASIAFVGFEVDAHTVATRASAQAFATRVSTLVGKVHKLLGGDAAAAPKK